MTDEPGDLLMLEGIALFVGLRCCDIDFDSLSMLLEQIDEVRAIQQRDRLIFDEFSRIGSKVRGRHQDPLRCPLRDHGCIKVPYG